MHQHGVIAWPDTHEREQLRARVPNVTAHIHPGDQSAPARGMLSERFRWCVGMLDGVCFEIPKYHGTDDFYVARKGRHALTVLVVCDPYGFVRHAEPAFKVHQDRTAYTQSTLFTNTLHDDGPPCSTSPTANTCGFNGPGFVACPFSKPSLILREEVRQRKPGLRENSKEVSQAAPMAAIRDGRRHLNTRLKWFRAQIEHVFGSVKSCYRSLLGAVTIAKGPELVWKGARVVFALYNPQRMHRGAWTHGGIWRERQSGRRCSRKWTHRS